VSRDLTWDSQGAGGDREERSTHVTIVFGPTHLMLSYNNSDERFFDFSTVSGTFEASSVNFQVFFSVLTSLFFLFYLFYLFYFSFFLL
jgi:hypothetical protein